MLAQPPKAINAHTVMNPTLLPIANSHNEQHHMSTSFSLLLSPTGQPNFADFTCNIHVLSENKDSWSGQLNKKKKSPGNHRLSLVLMKENNSLTYAKTVQKQPFLMSDTSRPPDTFYVSNSLIKQHPRRAWHGETVRTSESKRACVCVCKLFGVWIVRCNFETLIFTQQRSIRLVVVLFSIFLSDSLAVLRWIFYFFLPRILKESKGRSVIPYSEVRRPQKKDREWKLEITVLYWKIVPLYFYPTRKKKVTHGFPYLLPTFVLKSFLVK